jgi:hypothetical protein
MPFKIETRESAPMKSGDAEVVVRSRAIQLALPFAHGGLIWNRPVSVTVRRPGVPEQTLPIHDVTRLVQLALLALGVAGALLFHAAARANNKQTPSTFNIHL